MNTKSTRKLLTGFEPLDSIIGGFHYGNLITLAGRPCMRTDYFVYTLMRYWLNTEENGEDFVFFSLRNRDKYVTRRMGIQLAEDRQAPLRWTAEYHMRGIDLVFLCDCIREYVWKEQKRVFVIDNFNFIGQGEIRDLRHERHIIARELSKLAHELDIIIIVDAMLFSYYIEDREGIESKYPTLGDLGYQGMSGDLDVYSDMVLGFWVPEKYHIYQNERGEDLRGILEIEVLKNVNDDYSEGRRISLYINGDTLCTKNPMKQQDLNPFNSKATGPF